MSDFINPLTAFGEGLQTQTEAAKITARNLDALIDSLVKNQQPLTEAAIHAREVMIGSLVRNLGILTIGMSEQEAQRVSRSTFGEAALTE